MEYGTNTYNFLLSIPKKQAKSYEIDLGQNNGAYDEELLIRYGDNTLNHMKNKNRGGNLNMDDIMKMNEQLRPFQERQAPEEGVVSYGQLCDKIENDIGKCDDNTTFLTDFEKNLNKAIEVMTNDIFKFFDDTYNEFNPKLLEKYSYLKSKIKEQKDENANLLKQIDFLLQENTQIMDMVYKVGSRLEKLEKKAGVDKLQESVDKNLDEQQSAENEENLSENENESHSNSSQSKTNKEGEENNEGEEMSQSQKVEGAEEEKEKMEEGGEEQLMKEDEKGETKENLADQAIDQIGQESNNQSHELEEEKA